METTRPGKQINSIRCCRRCNNVRTFVYTEAGRYNMYRTGADGKEIAYSDDLRFSPPIDPSLRCPKCGGVEKVNTVTRVRVTKHECNAKCMSSLSGKCECSCGGKNHGMSYAA